MVRIKLRMTLAFKKDKYKILTQASIFLIDKTKRFTFQLIIVPNNIYNIPEYEEYINLSQEKPES